MKSSFSHQGGKGQWAVTSYCHSCALSSLIYIPETASGSMFPVVLVAAGIAVGAVLIVVVIIVVICCCRLTKNRKHPTSSRAFISVNYASLNPWYLCLHSVLWCCWFGVRKGICWLVINEDVYHVTTSFQGQLGHRSRSRYYAMR